MVEIRHLRFHKHHLSIQIEYNGVGYLATWLRQSRNCNLTHQMTTVNLQALDTDAVH